MQRTLSALTIQCIQGDITAQHDIDAIVNAANAQLRPGGGVAGAIHRAAGPHLDQACRALAPIKPGQAVITPAFDLPNKYIIHCLGPVYGSDEPAAELLASCYTSALRLAEEHQLTTLATPSISTGIFGYPLEEAAHTALRAVAETARQLRSVNLVRFVLWDDEALAAHEDALAAV